MSDSDSLTVEDLRTKLYSSLHKKGLVDSMKSQLRSKLVTELRQISIGEPLSLKPSQTNDDDKVTLLQRAANSVVVDHLRHCHYDYSLSVFLPESGITHAKVFTMRDLLQLLSISPSSTLHKSLTQKIASSDSKKGFLWELLTELSRSKGRCTQDIGTQSDVQILTSQSLDDKFKEIDDYFATRLDDTKVRGLAIEERILSYQRQMEERSRSDVKLELARYKETELTRVRFEEREKCRSELEKSRNQLEQTYQAKLEGVISRERNATERIQKQQEIQEKEVVAQRQSTLDQIELVRQRENDVRRQLELFNREKKLLEDKMKSREELARQRENINKKNEMEYEQRLRDTTQRYKLDIQTQLSEKQQDIEIRELRVKENEIRVGDDMRDIGDVKNELRIKRKQVHELEAELQKSKHECIGAQQQVDMLNERLRGMVDYQIIKQENAVMKHELDDVKMRLAEGQRDMMLERQKHEELLREMGERASRPTPEMLLLQQELERTKAALRQEQNMGIQQRRHAQHRIHQEMAMNSNLVKEYEKQDAEHREMSVHMKDLQSHLNHTQRVLHNEAYRTAPTITNPDRSLSLCDLDQGGHDDIIDDLLSQDLPSVLHRGDLECAHPSDLQQSDDYSYSSDIVKETRRRLQSLEKEADHLEQNYRNFQYKLTSDIGLAQDPLLPKNTQKLLETRSKGQSNSYHSTRPQSSTPHSAHQFSLPPSSGHLLATQDHRSPPRMDVSISTVNSESPADQMGRTTTVTQNRTMRMEDLEARPGSPSIMVVEQTNISQPLPPIEREPAPIMSLDNAWKSEGKQKDNLEEMRLQQEREDREFEERMQRKEEERQKRQKEAAAREEEELSRMRGETPAPPLELAQTASETVEPVQAAAESDIDPVMLSYMKKVREQKQHEKQEPKVIKKTLDTWNRHRTISQSEQTQSQSDDISAAEVASASVEEDNDDFEGW